MENLTIISTTQTVQAQEEINGNTVNYSWYSNQNESPTAVNFSVNRGTNGSTEFTGNAVISGAYYPESGKFDIQNHNFLESDLVLYGEIWETCKTIGNGTEGE